VAGSAGIVLGGRQVSRDPDLLRPHHAPRHVGVPRGESPNVVGGTGLAILLCDGVLDGLRKNRHYAPSMTRTPSRRPSWKVSMMTETSTLGYSSRSLSTAASKA